MKMFFNIFRVLNRSRFVYQFINKINKYSFQLHRQRLIDRFFKSIDRYEVLSGQFKGTRFKILTAEFSGNPVQKLIGSYENELHWVWTSLIRNNENFIIIIGAAEGYYVNCLAASLPNSEIVAYESISESRVRCLENLKLIGAESSRVKLKGHCDPSELLQSIKDKRGFILCDIEGYEVKLFNTDVVKELRNFSLLIELHELKKSGLTITKVIQDKFKDSHEIVYINHRKYKQSDYLRTLGFTQIEQDTLINERRKYSVGWVFLRPKQ